MQASVRDTALAGLDLGLSMVIVHAVGEPRFERDGDKWVQPIDRKTGKPAVYGAKIPCGRWKERQHTPATPDELLGHLSHNPHGPERGVAIVCGYGGVELFEFDDVPTWQRFLERAWRDDAGWGKDVGVWPIFERVMNGYMEESPRGAPHFFYRCEDLAGGGPLARRPEIVAGDEGSKKLKVLIETRGPGQIAVIAPSPGTCHKTGKPYVLLNGGLASIVTLTPAERRILHDYARTFDEAGPDVVTPAAEWKRRPMGWQPARGLGDEKPGDHFNRVCTLEMWRDMLATWKWQYVGAVGGREHCWIHATASSALSANLTPKGTLLIYSTSTPLAAWSPAKPTTHTPFHVYAAVSHRGDHQAAGKALYELGYGSRRPARRLDGQPA